MTFLPELSQKERTMVAIALQALATEHAKAAGRARRAGREDEGNELSAQCGEATLLAMRLEGLI